MLTSLLAWSVVSGSGSTVLPPAPGPLDNPLKGWALYSDQGTVYSVKPTMAYFYVSWRELEPERGKYNFEGWEKRVWSSDAAAGKHIIFRLFLEYPTQPTGLPQWLIDQGIKRMPYKDHGGGLSPNYDDPRLLEPLLELISAMGRRYNKNPRIAFLPIGTLGHWGEWHTYPDNDFMASIQTQRRVVDAYRRAFPDKKMLARYPYAETSKPWLGYHDDYFPEDTGTKEDWHFLFNLKKAGLTDNWKTQVFGAEMVPGKATTFLGSSWDLTKEMAEAARLTWMGPYAPPLESGKGSLFQERQEWLTRRMGYEYRLTRLSQTGVTYQLQGMNQGLAPFYYPWQVETGWLGSDGKVRGIRQVKTDIRKWLPGPFSVSLSPGPAPTKASRLVLGIRDPWTGKPAIRFANALPVKEGWTVLTRLPAETTGSRSRS